MENTLFTIDKEKGAVIVNNYCAANYKIDINSIVYLPNYKTLEDLLKAIEIEFFEKRRHTLDVLKVRHEEAAYTCNPCVINTKEYKTYYQLKLPIQALGALHLQLKKQIENNRNYKAAYRRNVTNYMQHQIIQGIGEAIDMHNYYAARISVCKQAPLAVSQLITGDTKEVALVINSATYDLIISTLNILIGNENIQIDNVHNTPELKYQCKLSSLLKGKNTDGEYYVNEYRNFVEHARHLGFPENSAVVISLLEKNTIIAPVKDLKLRMIYPYLKQDLNQLRVSSPGVIDGVVQKRDWLIHQWQLFNTTKNKLILLGYKEQQVAKFISNIALKCNTVICELTNQVIPACMAVTVVKVDGKVIIANAYYISHINYRLQSGGLAPWYIVEINTKTYIERRLDAKEYYIATLFGHNANVMDYLSVRSLPNENTQVINKSKLYRPEPYLGVELEIERRGKLKFDVHGNEIPDTFCPEEVTELVLNDLSRGFVIIKHDGTLKGHNPFEIVTVPATLQYQQYAWATFMDNTKLKKMLQSYTSGNCGMHVHISRDAFTGLKLAKFMRFFNCEENKSFITKIAQRGDDNRYAQYARNKSIMQHVTNIHQRSRRNNEYGVDPHYEAINTSNANTIEVRIFRGNLGKLQFYKNIEFVHAVFCYMDEASLANLNYKDFLYWLFKNNKGIYSNLHKWLIAEGFNVSNIAMPADMLEVDKSKLIVKQEEIKRIQANLKRKFNVTKIKVGDKETITMGKGKFKVNVEEELMSA